MEKRDMIVPFGWWDKEVTRFFRRNFSGACFKNLKAVYGAVCEISSDFEDKPIKSIVKTIATYSGIEFNNLRPYLKALCKSNLIDYEQTKGGESILTINKWEGGEEFEREIKTAINKCVGVSPIGVSHMQNTYFHVKHLPYKNNSVLCNTSILHNTNNIFVEEDQTDKNIPNKIIKTHPIKINKKDLPKKITNELEIEYQELAKQLIKIVTTRRKINIPNSKIVSWGKEISKLAKEINKTPIFIKRKLDWYAIHNKDPYVPVIESGKSLREKFTKLLDAIERDKKSFNNSNSNNPSGSKFVPYDRKTRIRSDEDKAMDAKADVCFQPPGAKERARIRNAEIERENALFLENLKAEKEAAQKKKEEERIIPSWESSDYS